MGSATAGFHAGSGNGRKSTGVAREARPSYTCAVGARDPHGKFQVVLYNCLYRWSRRLKSTGRICKRIQHHVMRVGSTNRQPGSAFCTSEALRAWDWRPRILLYFGAGSQCKTTCLAMKDRPYYSPADRADLRRGIFICDDLRNPGNIFKHLPSLEWP